MIENFADEEILAVQDEVFGSLFASQIGTADPLVYAEGTVAQVARDVDPLPIDAGDLVDVLGTSGAMIFVAPVNGPAGPRREILGGRNAFAVMVGDVRPVPASEIGQ